jgi:riboflavin biosynthesis pyrimidine reductase
MRARVAANLIVGSDGSTTFDGSSAGLSFSADRTRFHQLRQDFGAILIGGNTARQEPYMTTPVPLIVLSRDPLPDRLLSNEKAVAWNLPLETAVTRGMSEFGDLLFESGPGLLMTAINAGLIQELFLTISNQTGGEGVINPSELTQGAELISSEEVPGGQFLHYRLAPSHH